MNLNIIDKIEEVSDEELDFEPMGLDLNTGESVFCQFSNLDEETCMVRLPMVVHEIEHDDGEYYALREFSPWTDNEFFVFNKKNILTVYPLSDQFLRIYSNSLKEKEDNISEPVNRESDKTKH